jgi:hypothetical protein
MPARGSDILHYANVMLENQNIGPEARQRIPWTRTKIQTTMLLTFPHFEFIT